MPGYDISNDVKSVADDLIAKQHPKLAGLKIAYLFRDEAAISNGKVEAARASRVDDRNWALTRTDFIIEVARDVWDQASVDFRVAVLDHELCHIGIHCDENGAHKRDAKTNRVKGFIRHHDMEEFEDVVERYGSYRQDLRAFFQAYLKGRTTKSLKKTDPVKEAIESEEMVE